MVVGITVLKTSRLIFCFSDRSVDCSCGISMPRPPPKTKKPSKKGPPKIEKRIVGGRGVYVSIETSNLQYNNVFYFRKTNILGQSL